MSSALAAPVAVAMDGNTLVAVAAAPVNVGLL